MKIYTNNVKEWNIEFIYSPLFEMLCSLHVLAKPQHHLERLIWAEDMKASLPDRLYEGLMEFSKKTCEWCTIMDLCNIYDECDDFNIIAAINFIEDLPMEAFAKVFEKYRDYGDMQLNESSIKEMLRLLKEYYFLYFEKELRFIEPLLIRRLKKDSDYCRNIGILEYVKGIHNRIEVTDHAFLFHKFTLFTVPYKCLKRVIIRISSFIDPHLLMDYGDDMVQFTVRVHLNRGVNEVPKDLLRLMKALSDETRLKMLRILYKEKASTQSLSKKLELTEANISKHLKMLYDADLLYKERCGSYIYYYLNSSLLDRIPMDIHEYLNFSGSKPINL